MIASIQRTGDTDPVRTYYCLLLQSIAANVTGAQFPAAAPFQDMAASLIGRFSEFERPQEPADLFKDLYLELFPADLRHGLGEYYTPDWLAEKLLESTLGPDLGNPAKRVLDPACGSGTFLVHLIKHVRRRISSEGITPARALDLILRNVVGCDVHPLAVLTAKANYLLALGDLLDEHRKAVEPPVYLADSVLTPAPHSGLEQSCHFIVGNPPWINWQNIPDEYRRRTRPLWEHYGLFPKRRNGMQTILGAAKYDLSMLMTYVAADRYLRTGGRLGFVVSQTLFKVSAAGQGFRRFHLPDATPLGVCRVEDLVKLKPFDSAANRTATLVLEKGRETEYPVEYLHHSKARRHQWIARPISRDLSSPWICARPGALAALARILGTSPYRAREGANTGGANAVFWLDVEPHSPGLVTARNVTQGGRNRVASTSALVEAGLVYPLLRGQNVSRWRAVAEHSILLPHRPGMRLRAISEAEMKESYPRALSYLSRFEDMLRRRPAYKRYFKPEAPCYSLFNIGDYTFAPWKVVWREQALPFTAAVVGPSGPRVVVPDHKLMIVPVQCEDEANYLCAVLNSIPVSAVVAAYTIETQIDTHVLDHIAVPRFDPEDPVHRALADASRQAHRAAEENDPACLQRAESVVDRWVARLWGHSEQELAEIRTFLEEAGLIGA